MSSNYEVLTASPEALGNFLASLPVANSPWDECFSQTFCSSCEREDCDTDGCPYQDKRNNPTWWLAAEDSGEQQGPPPRQLPLGDGDRDRPDCLRQINRHLGTGTERMNAGEKARNRHGLGIHRTGN